MHMARHEKNAAHTGTLTEDARPRMYKIAHISHVTTAPVATRAFQGMLSSPPCTMPITPAALTISQRNAVHCASMRTERRWT